MARERADTGASYLRIVAVFGIAMLAVWVSACTAEKEPTVRVQLGQSALDMMISDQWKREESSTESRSYRHKRFTGVELHLSSEVEDLGSPLLVPHVKELIAKELNRRFGGVSTRVSLGGNAMIKYSRMDEDDYGDSRRREEWVIAKPVGFSEVLRVSISLRIPEVAESYEGLPALISALDRRVGDARIPRA